MVRRYAHMSVKHLQPYADQLIFSPQINHAEEARKSAEVHGTESPTPVPKVGLRIVVKDGVRC